MGLLSVYITGRSQSIWDAALGLAGVDFYPPGHDLGRGVIMQMFRGQPSSPKDSSSWTYWSWKKHLWQQVINKLAVVMNNV